MKRFSLRAAVIAFALILAMTGGALAAANQWKIGDYFGKRGPGSAPEGFESGFDADYTQEIGEVRFHIRDAYISGSTLTAMVEVERKDGKPAIFVTEGFDESDLIANFDQVLSFEPEDRRTIAEYARDEDLPIYHAGSWFTQNGKMSEGAEDEWAEDNFERLVMLLQVQDIQSENGMAKLSWDIYLADQENGYQPQSLEIQLPVEEFEAWTAEINQAVDGLPVTVERLELRQSRLELDTRIVYRLDREQMPLDAPEDSPAAHDYRFIHLFDPRTDEKLPVGSKIVGFDKWLDDEKTVIMKDLDSVRGEYDGDTLRLKFYDPWQDQYIAAIDVKIR